VCWLEVLTKSFIVLVYDGDCSFCCRCASWVERRSQIKLSPGTPEDLEILGISLAEAKRSVWWVEGDTRFSGHRAVDVVLCSLGGGWRILGKVMKVPPASWIAALVYRWVAANRHRFNG